MPVERHVLQKRKREVEWDATSHSPTTEVGVEALAESGYPVDFAPRFATLFERIGRRGQEPLFPASWQLDFLTLPNVLFLRNWSDPYFAPIRAMSSKESSAFRGKLAMENLLRTGREVRESLEMRKQGNEQKTAGQGQIIKSIRRFLRWSAEDATITLESLTQYVQICVLSRSERASKEADVFEALTTKMTQKLRKMASIHKDNASLAGKRSRRSIIGLFRRESEADEVTFERAASTTVYGFAVLGPRVAIVALNVRHADAPIRTLLICDFTDMTQDLWSALAIMLVICAAREERLDHSGLVALPTEKALASHFSRMRMLPTEDIDS